MQSIDNYQLARETIHHHFSSKGLVPCFLPKSSEEAGNGCHVHLSLWKDGKNITGEPTRRYGISEALESFMAGILAHYGALFHFLCPSPNSMRRISPD